MPPAESRSRLRASGSAALAGAATLGADVAGEGGWARQAFGSVFEQRPVRTTVGYFRIRYTLAILLLAALYYGSAHIGYALQFAGPVAAVVWLPVGVGIAFLYFGGASLWPGVVVGDLLANNYSALPIGSAIGQSCGNLLEVVVAALLIRRLTRGRSTVRSIGGLAGTISALAIGVAVSASIGSLSLLLGNVVHASALPKVWRTWWLGDFCGALVVVPLALAWFPWPQRGWWRGRALEGTLMLTAVVGLSELALLRGHGPLTYLVFPALIWAALRFGPRGATVAIAVAASLTIWMTTHYAGSFVFHSVGRSVTATQLYIAVAGLATLCLAAVVAEREEFAQRLTASRTRLVEAAETERRRLEHNLHDGAQQRLVGLLIRLGGASEQVRAAPGEAGRLFSEAEKELSLAIVELRELARGIHPTTLTDLGLAHAVKSLAQRSSVPIELSALPSVRLESSAEATAYYVVAEAVTNAQKHARASVIRIGVTLVGDVLSVEVTDDGVGGAVEVAGSGLEGLRDRVEAVGGKLDKESSPGRGTRIRATIPVSGRVAQLP